MLHGNYDPERNVKAHLKGRDAKILILDEKNKDGKIVRMYGCGYHCDFKCPNIRGVYRHYDVCGHNTNY